MLYFKVEETSITMAIDLDAVQYLTLIIELVAPNNARYFTTLLLRWRDLLGEK